MKTKVLLTMLSLLLVLLFAACEEESGDSMDEDYAGTWYGYWLDGYYIKLDLTDTSYKSSYYSSGWHYDSKGDISKNGNYITVTATHYYDDGWVSMSPEDWYGSYVVTESESGTVLTLDVASSPDGSGTVTMYSYSSY